MTKYLIFTISALIVVVLLLASCLENITTNSKAFAQFPVPNANSIIIHTTNSIQGNSLSLIKLLPIIRKAILSNIDNAIFMAKGSVKSIIPVNVNARITNQLANSRIDTTQGIDMTKRLIATELINAINTTTTDNNVPSHLSQQPIRVAVDNQAICTGIASASKAACAFTINIHK